MMEDEIEVAVGYFVLSSNFINFKCQELLLN